MIVLSTLYCYSGAQFHTFQLLRVGCPCQMWSNSSFVVTWSRGYCLGNIPRLLVSLLCWPILFGLALLPPPQQHHLPTLANMVYQRGNTGGQWLRGQGMGGGNAGRGSRRGGAGRGGAGRGDAGQGDAGRGRGGGVPFNAPTGPAADRGRHQSSSAAPSSSFVPSSSPAEGGQRPMAPPSQYKAPQGNYTDQTAVGHVGLGPKWTDCLRCNKPRGASHPEFRNCQDLCGFCHLPGHKGEPCGLLYCSDKWWSEHYGQTPPNVQRRPSEVQRQRLAAIDPYFANFPAEIHPQGKKRGFGETLDDVEIVKIRAAEEFLRKERNEAMVLANAEKSQRMLAEKQMEEMQKLIDEQDAKIRGLEQEMAAREDAVARREALLAQERSDMKEEIWRAISDIFDRDNTVTEPAAPATVQDNDDRDTEAKTDLAGAKIKEEKQSPERD
jgi:hypothetical protein